MQILVIFHQFYQHFEQKTKFFRYGYSNFFFKHHLWARTSHCVEKNPTKKLCSGPAMSKINIFDFRKSTIFQWCCYIASNQRARNSQVVLFILAWVGYNWPLPLFWAVFGFALQRIVWFWCWFCEDKPTLLPIIFQLFSIIWPPKVFFFIRYYYFLFLILFNYLLWTNWWKTIE